MGLNWDSWSTVSEGMAAPRGVITAATYEQQLALFITDSNNVVRMITNAPNGWWTGSSLPIAWRGPWVSVADGQAPPGSPVTVLPWGDWPFAVFVTGLDGVVYTTAGNPQDGFPGGWAPILGIRAAPGSPVTVVPSYFQYATPGFSVFVTGLDGVIYTTTGNPQDGFGLPGNSETWTNLSGITSPPGSPVTSTMRRYPFYLYASDVHGGVYTTATGDWLSVMGPQGISAPGSPVTVFETELALNGLFRNLLFVTAPNGEVIFTTLQSES
jgi:hypothetical protein